MGRNVITEARYKKNGNLVSYPLGAKAENITVGENSTLDTELNNIKKDTDTSFTTPTDISTLENLDASGEKINSAFEKIYKVIKRFINHIGNGENHIPPNGESGQILVWASKGNAAWGNQKTYSVFGKSGSSASTGLVPKPSTTAGVTKYLREDGQWITPPNTTYTLSSITGTLALAKGGTGATTAEAARTNLGLGTAATRGVITSSGSIAPNNGGLVTADALYNYLANFSSYLNKNSENEMNNGTLTIKNGNLWINNTATSNETKLTIGNSLKSGAFKVDTSGNLGVYDATKGKWLVKSDTSGNVTLNGYSLNKSVPSNAKFTDTTYSVYGGTAGSIGTTAGLVPVPDDSEKWWGYLRGDGAWVRPTDSITNGDGSKTPVQSGAVYKALQPVVKDSGIESFVITEGKISNMIIDNFIIPKGTWIIIASGIFYNNTVPVDRAEFGFKTVDTAGFPTDQPSCYGKAINWKSAAVEDKIPINLSTVITVTQNTTCVLKGRGSLQQAGGGSIVECDCRIIAVKIGL